MPAEKPPGREHLDGQSVRLTLLAQADALPRRRAHVFGGAGEAECIWRAVPLVEEMAQFVGDGVALAARSLSRPQDDLAFALARVGLQATLDADERGLHDVEDVQRARDLIDRHATVEIRQLSQERSRKPLRVRADALDLHPVEHHPFDARRSRKDWSRTSRERRSSGGSSCA